MFSEIFIERPRLAMVISLVLLFAGAISIPNIPVAEYPEIAPPQIFVGCNYAGASAQAVQETVAVPLEAEINGVEHLLYFTSSCDDNGSYSCSIVFQSGIDYDMAMVNVQNAVKRAEAKLPEEVKKVGVNIHKRSGDFLTIYAFLSDDDYSLLDLNNFVNTTIKDGISRLEGVSSVAVFGERVYSMRIWLDPFRMAGLGITTANIIAAIQSQNLQAAAGTIGSESSNEYVEYKIDMKGRLLTTEDFGNIVLRTGSDGSMVKISDIARVELGSRSYSGMGLLDGKPCVGMAAFRTSDANALDTVNNINKLLEEYKPRFPEGVHYEVAYDPTKFIKTTIKEIVETLIIALVLVIVITFLFLQDWRATIVPAVAIPVSLLATFPVIYILGYSINVLTMFGLILVIGSLVDDAIVVVENCQSLMEREGLSARDAASKSMQQITGAIIATTLVTVACYVPLAFYGGMVGNIYRQFSVTMCVSLCFSTLVALTLSPALCSLILRPPRKKALWVFAPFNLILNCSRSIYLFVVKLLVRRGLITIILFAVCCWLAVKVHGMIPSAFLPTEDKGVILCNLELSPGATLARTERALTEFRDKVKDIGGIKSCFSVSGQNIINGNGENYGMLIVQLKDWNERESKELSHTAILQSIQLAAATIPSASVNCFIPPAIMGLGATGGVSYKICSDSDSDPVKLSAVAQKMSYELTMRPETLYVMSSFNANTPQIYFDLDREKAQSLNVSVANVFATLQSKLASFYINDFTMNGENYYVKIQADAAERRSIENIDELMIPSNTGGEVPLSSLGTMRYTVGPKVIQRMNKLMCAGMNGMAAPGVTSGELMKVIEETPLPKGYHIEWVDLSYQEKNNENQLGLLIGLACLFAYLFLVGQYESWCIPVPVMLSVVIALLGGLIGLKVTHSELGIYAQLGLVMLIGLAGKNAILMVEFSKQEHEIGVPITEAAINGANMRYRAVLMTAWSFLFGVWPLVVANGAGAASRQSIGITTFSGMLLATIVGICFTPALYAVMQRIREFIKYTVFRMEH